MKKIIATTILIVALVVFAFYVANSNALKKEAPAVETTRNPNDKQNIAAIHTASDFSFRIENAADYDDTFPKQILFLDVNGKEYRIGEYMGCSDANSNAPREPNEIVRRSCWFGGGGNDLSIFSENGKYILKERWTQESGGEEVNTATEGPFQVLFEIN